jgi:hypothetical protein
MFDILSSICPRCWARPLTSYHPRPSRRSSAALRKLAKAIDVPVTALLE